MEILYVVGTYPTLLEDMVAKVYEANAPNAVVDTIVLPERDISGTPAPGGGHNVNVNVTFTGLDDIPHILRLFTDSGTLLQEFNALPTRNVVTLFDPIYFIIGDGGVNTPTAGTDTYSNSDLAGLDADELDIFRNGTILHPSVEYDTDPGGFHLLFAGDIFSTGERFIIRRKPVAVTNLVNDSVVGKQFGPTTANANIFVNVANTTKNFDITTDLRKLIRLSGNSGKYYFLSGDAVPIGYPFRFSNQVGGTATIYFQNAGLITPAGDASTFSLASGQVAEFVYDGTKWNITQNSVVTPPTYTVQGPYITSEFTINNPDEFFTVTIPNQGTTNYTILAAPEGQNSDQNSDNDVSWTIHHPTKTNTSFQICVRRYAGAGPKLKFRYIIIK